MLRLAIPQPERLRGSYLLCNHLLHSCNRSASPDSPFRLYIQVCPCLTLSPFSFPYLSLSRRCLVCGFPLSFRGAGSSRKLWSRLSSGTKSSTLCTFAVASGRGGGVAAAGSALATGVVKTQCSPQARQTFAFYRSILPRAAAATKQDLGYTARGEEGYEQDTQPRPESCVKAFTDHTRMLWFKVHQADPGSSTV